MAQEGTLSYNISANGRAGDWYWEVVGFDRELIARGLAPTMEEARAEALKAATLRIDRRSQESRQLSGSALTSLPFRAA